MKNNAVTYHNYGKPSETLSLETLELSDLGPKQVRIEIQASTIHPSDMGMIQGSYGNLKELPAVAGREGVGKIVEVGKDVTKKVFNKVVSIPDGVGAWQEYCQVNVDDLILLPALVPYATLAVSCLNPLTAWRLLNDFEYLKEGDVIIQNAANSAVGLSVIQFAKRMGVTCVNLVRTNEMREKVLKFGAEEVWLDDENVPSLLKDYSQGKGCVMALNSVGGKSALRLAKCLRRGGVHVTFGAMIGEPVRFPTRNLIFDDIRFVGFWLDRWKRQRTPAQFREALENVLQPLALTEINHPIDSVFELKDYKAAIQRNSESRFGKVLLAKDKQTLEESIS